MNTGAKGYCGATLSTPISGTTFTVNALLNELYSWLETPSRYGFCDIVLKFKDANDN
jgi:hypothetical protein